jgi:hypothetical protein
MKTIKITIAIFVLVLFTSSCSKDDSKPTPEPPFSFTENFDDTTDNLKSRGWAFVKNNSNDGFDPFWHKGYAYNYDAHQGEPESYISIDDECVAGDPQITRTIDSWLITPTVKLQNGDIITFYTRTKNSFKVDKLSVSISTQATTINPTSSSNGSFTKSILEINPSSQNTYPVTWTKYSITIEGLTAPTDCKIGFQYFFSPGGRFTSFSNCLGLDTFKITRP